MWTSVFVLLSLPVSVDFLSLLARAPGHRISHGSAAVLLRASVFWRLCAWQRPTARLSRFLVLQVAATTTTASAAVTAASPGTNGALAVLCLASGFPGMGCQGLLQLAVARALRCVARACFLHAQVEDLVEAADRQSRFTLLSIVTHSYTHRHLRRNALVGGRTGFRQRPTETLESLKAAPFLYSLLFSRSGSCCPTTRFRPGFTFAP